MLSPGSGPTEIYNYFSFSLEVPRPVWEKKNVCVGGAGWNTWNSAWLDSENKILFSKSREPFLIIGLIPSSLLLCLALPPARLVASPGQPDTARETEREREADWLWSSSAGWYEGFRSWAVFFNLFFPHRQINVQTGLNCCRDAPWVRERGVKETKGGFPAPQSLGMMSGVWADESVERKRCSPSVVGCCREGEAGRVPFAWERRDWPVRPQKGRIVTSVGYSVNWDCFRPTAGRRSRWVCC